MNKTIMRVKFGSHLYGTNTPTSDTDYKSIHLPHADQIILQRVQNVVSKSTGDPLTKNTKDDIDDESYSLSKFLGMLRSGDMVAYEMLFVPQNQLDICTPEWQMILSCRNKLIDRNITGFVGYIRQQVNKYGVKGSRIAAARAATEFFDVFRGSSKAFKRVGDIPLDTIQTHLVNKHDYIKLLYLPNSANDPREMPYLEVLNRKIDFRTGVGDAFKIVKRIFDEYGSRALAAETNQGVDWKAVYHAIRVSEQALELNRTGQITFPRPNVKELLKIKRGEYHFKDIAERLENNLELLEAEMPNSVLPEKYCEETMDSMLLFFYLNQVKSEYQL